MHRVEIDRSAAVVVVVGGGELDAYAAPDLSQAFTSVAGEDRIVVDFETVSFLDSTALGVVVKAIREVDERRGMSVDRPADRPGATDLRDHDTRSRPRDRTHSR